MKPYGEIIRSSSSKNGVTHKKDVCGICACSNRGLKKTKHLKAKERVKNNVAIQEEIDETPEISPSS